MKKQQTVPDPTEAQAEIASLLKRTGLTISEIARETKTPTTTVWEWAKDGSEPVWSNWKRFWLQAVELPDKSKNGSARKGRK